MIRIEHLRKEYPTAVPLQDVNVEIHKGDVISVIGHSGTSKSTLIRCLNLLDQPTSGKILIGDEEITVKGANVARIQRKMGIELLRSIYNIQAFLEEMCVQIILP